MIGALKNYTFSQRKRYLKYVLAYYKFDEELDYAKDYKNGYNLMARVGTQTWENRKVGKSITFNSNQSGFRASSPFSFQMLNSTNTIPFSISVWVKLADTIPTSGTKGYLFGLLGQTGSTKHHYLLSIPASQSSTNRKVRFEKFDNINTAKSRKILCDVSLPFNEWILITYTDTGIVGEEKIYINNTLMTNIIVTDTGYEKFSGRPYGVGISMHSIANYSNLYFPGSLDELVIFKNYALTIEDIIEIYNDGYGVNLLY